MNTQDWTPIILKKSLNKEDLIKKLPHDIEKKYHGGENKVNDELNLRKLDSNEEVVKPPISNAILSKQLQTARLSKKLSQDELNKICNLPPNTIKNYELNKAIAKTSELSAIGKKLGISLKMPHNY
jgi:ribosome-binding protein aMBF1 (putative translation factor)